MKRILLNFQYSCFTRRIYLKWLIGIALAVVSTFSLSYVVIFLSGRQRERLILYKLDKIVSSPIIKCDSVDLNHKLNCFPLQNVTAEQCVNLGCCWCNVCNNDNSEVIPCFFSTKTVRYEVHNITRIQTGLKAILNLVSYSGFQRDVKKLQLTINFCSENLAQIKIVDFFNARFEVPLPLHFKSSVNTSVLLYDVIVHDNGTLHILRKLSNTIIFRTDLSKLIYSDQFVQISAFLPTSYIYGLADHIGPLLRNTNWTRYTFFNRDQIPTENMNLYSSFPFYMVMEEAGYCHGVYLFNSNAMDVILQPAPAITYRTVGGVLDFFVFLGPSPKEVVKEYSHLIGLPMLPPYWSLGFHLCRLGYFTLNNTIKVWNRTVNADIPFDTQWNDIDVMGRYNDFTYDKEKFENLPQFIEQLHQMGMHYVLIVDPGISSAEPSGTYPPYDDGLANGIFITNSSGQLLHTKVWNKVSSVFPDFTHSRAAKYWEKQLEDLHSVIEYDGIWLDMNEPTNFLNGSFEGCPDLSTYEHPQYVPGDDPLCTKTICMTARHNISLHYNVHNIYGTFETELTYRALVAIRNKRPFVLTRAGFPGIGQYSAMWNGDVISIWNHLRASVSSILGYSINGVPFVGADICGFNNNTSVELCARWFQLGAFYPFCRNHNSDENIEQDPVALGPVVVQAAKSALSVRYFLLPYLYTLMFYSHTQGSTVARPLFFEYPEDVESYAVEHQFLWGAALMIIPVVEPGVVEVLGYFPPDVWYDFYNGKRTISQGENYTLLAPMDKINLAVRGGYVLPAQEPNKTTSLCRENQFALIIALNLEGDASGQLFWDDGNSLNVESTRKYNLIQFDVANNELKSSIKQKGYIAKMVLGQVKVFGLLKEPKLVEVNGLGVPFDYVTTTQVLVVDNLSVALLNPLTINW